MSKDFTCRTCGHLCTVEWDKIGEKTLLYCCDWNSEFVVPDEYFCANHSDRETVKRIREGL